MKVSYYPGCSLHGTAKEYDQSVRVVSRALGIELEEIEDWSCCGASSAHNTNFKLSIALPARDLIAADKKTQDIMIPCAACFNRFKTADHHLRHDQALKAEIEEIVGGSYQGNVAIRNPIDIIANTIGLDALKEKVVKALVGLKPASYYGCLLLRPPEVCRFDDTENPVLLDKILAALGADVRPWSFKTDCCGGSLMISKTEIVVQMVDRLMKMAREAGANCLVTACPVCTANLDMRASKDLALPVFYFTELAALAMGQDGPEGWCRLHQTDPQPLLKGLGLL
ncbi:MAG: heterodisulfide reductase subunit B [Syntrophus sp. RIFOXYC2_FULL_54_9]|nr:MAG: heterodisulfide reductase subunit B [Syntrophus sp. RIFOXYC2_FULL_54_9]